MIGGNSFREESICCQILGPLNLIDLFPYWEQTGWQKYWPEVELLLSWVWTQLTAVNRQSNVLGILLLWKLCISLVISSWCMSSSFNKFNWLYTGVTWHRKELQLMVLMILLRMVFSLCRLFFFAEPQAPMAYCRWEYKAEIYHLEFICAQVLSNSIKYTRIAKKLAFKLWNMCIPVKFII